MQNPPPDLIKTTVSDTSSQWSAVFESIIATGSAYLELCKPRVVMLMLLTTIVGMQLAAPHSIPWNILFYGTLGVGLSAGAAAVINHLADRQIDCEMSRTQQRPIPTGKVTPISALIFAIILGITGLSILYFLVNPLTAFLTFLTQLGYAGIYTFYLKHNTSQNIVIGGLAGATPPLLGWTAVVGHIDLQGLLLVLIIFLWTPPHFWALAIHRYNDYKKLKIPMLPVTHGINYTKRQIFLYTLLLIVSTLLPYACGMSGLIYLTGMILLNVIFLIKVTHLMFSDDNAEGMNVFKFSIIYLMLLFVVLLVDHFFKF